MTASRRRFSQEFKDELCQELISTSKPIKDVAAAYGVGAETLRNWLIKYRDAHWGTETRQPIESAVVTCPEQRGALRAWWGYASFWVSEAGF
jgi:transposase